MLDTNEISEIESLIADGFVTKRKHPSLNLYILNYTPRAQYTNEWTPTMMRCRGLIVDDVYNVVGRPFPKFFNLNEKMTIETLPDEIPHIYEKLEGFFGILYSDNGIPAISTRGSFESTMATWATEWIRSTGLSMSDFLDDYTYIFEIIDQRLCRDERLIVDYGKRSECVLLAVIETATGLELDHIAEANDLGLPFAKRYLGSLPAAVSEMEFMRAHDQEGYVCRYSTGLRIKLKGDEYKRIHRLLSGLTPKRILNVLIESGEDGLSEMLGDIPDEFYDRVRSIVAKIRGEQTRLIEEGKLLYKNTEHLPTNSERATAIHETKNNSVAFAIFNGRSHDDVSAVALKGVRKTINSFATDWDRKHL